MNSIISLFLRKRNFYYRKVFARCTLCVTDFMKIANPRGWVLGKIKFRNNFVDYIKIASQTNRLPAF